MGQRLFSSTLFSYYRSSDLLNSGLLQLNSSLWQPVATRGATTPAYVAFVAGDGYGVVATSALTCWIQAADSSGAWPNDVARRLRASVWRVISENFAVAACRRSFSKALAAAVELSSGGFPDKLTSDRSAI